MSDLNDLQKRALEIAQLYDNLNKKAGRNLWTGKDYMMGFTGDVGDLSKLVMAKENMRDIDDVDAKLAHELSDCLWSILILAKQYNVDLEEAFLKTTDELKERIAA